MMMNPILLTDFYKWAHMSQYDPSIVKLVSYGTPRGCRLPNKDYVVNFGVQAFCKEYLIRDFKKFFFNRNRESIKASVTEFLTNTLPGVDVEFTVNKIMELHALGYLPLSIRTIPEGGKVELGCPNIELVTTVEGFQWVSGYIESLLSSFIWKPMIDATVGHWYREIANKYFEKTADNWEVKSRSAMSEFGFRGADSPESGVHSGAGWLLSFDKTATCAAIPWVNKMYNVVPPSTILDVTDNFNKFKESNPNATEDDFLTALDNVYGSKISEALPDDYNKLDLPDWMIDINKYTAGILLSINGKVYDEDDLKLTNKEVGIVGKGLISTEHSVMCSSTALNIGHFMKDEVADVTKYYNMFKYEVSQAKIYYLSQVRDFWKGYKDGDEVPHWVIPYVVWSKNKYFKVDDEIFKYTKNDMFKEMKDDSIQKLAEAKFVKKLLTDIYPNSSFSMVSDSYDYWRMVTKILPSLKDDVMNHNGTLFVRGDSGDPVKIVAGYVNLTPILYTSTMEVNVTRSEVYPTCLLIDVANIEDYRSMLLELMKLADKGYVVFKHNGKYHLVNSITLRHDTAEINAYEVSMEDHVQYGTVECLWNTFGGTTNSKGYMVLDKHIRAIYGDSITQERQELIYQILELKNFSVENVALGAGSFSFHCYQDQDGKLYPYTRDTYNFAQKATYGEWEERHVGSSADGSGGRQLYTKLNPLNIYKDPKTDSDHFKKSMKGCCAIYKAISTNGDERYFLSHDGLTLQERESDTDNELVEIFKDGRMTHEWTFSEIRNRLNNGMF